MAIEFSSTFRKAINRKTIPLLFLLSGLFYLSGDLCSWFQSLQRTNSAEQRVKEQSIPKMQIQGLNYTLNHLGTELMTVQAEYAGIEKKRIKFFYFSPFKQIEIHNLKIDIQGLELSASSSILWPDFEKIFSGIFSDPEARKQTGDNSSKRQLEVTARKVTINIHHNKEQTTIIRCGLLQKKQNGKIILSGPAIVQNEAYRLMSQQITIGGDGQKLISTQYMLKSDSGIQTGEHLEFGIDPDFGLFMINPKEVI